MMTEYTISSHRQNINVFFHSCTLVTLRDLTFLLADNEEPFLVLTPDAVNNLEHLRSACELLRNTKPLKAILHRDTKVYKKSSQASRFQLPQDFYRITPEEVKREQQLRCLSFKGSQTTLISYSCTVMKLYTYVCFPKIWNLCKKKIVAIKHDLYEVLSKLLWFTYLGPLWSENVIAIHNQHFIIVLALVDIWIFA